MPGHGHRKRWRDKSALAALLLLPLLAGGCGSSILSGITATAPSPAAAPAPAPASSPTPSTSQWLKQDIASFFSGSSDKAPQAVAGASPDVECPYIDIREGASTLTIGGGGENAAMSLKYQGIFVRAARQCAVVAGQMVMKVGVQGRIVLGPAGGPGQIDVPLRIAVVDESPSGMKPIVTKLIHIPVMVQSATANPTFTHVEDGLSFPLPSAAQLDRYIVYIGFDPLAAQPQEKHKPKPRPKHKPKGRQAPGTG